MNFIKQQQELARKKVGLDYPLSSGGYTTTRIDAHTLDTLITQIIKNTGEELMRRAKGEIRKPNSIADATIDTLKKHITSVTGVEMPTDLVSNQN